jgi:hypothetical protein
MFGVREQEPEVAALSPAEKLEALTKAIHEQDAEMVLLADEFRAHGRQLTPDLSARMTKARERWAPAAGRKSRVVGSVTGPYHTEP